MTAAVMPMPAATKHGTNSRSLPNTLVTKPMLSFIRDYAPLDFHGGPPRAPRLARSPATPKVRREGKIKILSQIEIRPQMGANRLRCLRRCYDMSKNLPRYVTIRNVTIRNQDGKAWNVRHAARSSLQ